MTKFIAQIKELTADKNNFIICLFFISLFVTHFPNSILYHLYTSSISIVLWIIILSDQQYRVELFKVFTKKNNRNIFAGIVLFLTFGALSLIYSTNITYGRYKLFGLLFDTLPAILAFYLIIQKLSERQLNFIVHLFLLAGIIFTSILYYKSHLTYLGRERILWNWSHVGFGKFLGYASLAAIFNSFKQRTITSFLISLYILSGLFLTGLRAPVIFVFCSCVVFAFYFLLHFSISRKRIAIVVLPMLFAVAVFFFVNQFKPELQQRLERSTTLDVNQTKDPSIKGRYLALRDAFEMIKEKPLLGWGLGGFNMHYNGTLHTRYYPYPHNIFAEISVELGIPMFVYFLFCLIVLLYHVFSIHRFLGIFFSLALWNALFAGDISFQKVLFISIAFLLLDPIKKENIAQLFATQKI